MLISCSSNNLLKYAIPNYDVLIIKIFFNRYKYNIFVQNSKFYSYMLVLKMILDTSIIMKDFYENLIYFGEKVIYELVFPPYYFITLLFYFLIFLSIENFIL